MSEPKWTPGPWFAKRALRPVDGEYDWAVAADFAGAGRCVIAEAFGMVAEATRAPAEANASLIAAAPKLDEALTRLLANYDEERQVIDVSADAGCIECTVGTVPNNRNTGLCPFHAARAALAKPRGDFE